MSPVPTARNRVDHVARDLQQTIDAALPKLHAFPMQRPPAAGRREVVARKSSATDRLGVQQPPALHPRAGDLKLVLPLRQNHWSASQHVTAVDRLVSLWHVITRTSHVMT
jgi:hypothetical protein